MHADERAADVEARIGSDVFQSDRVLERLVTGGGERTAGLGLGYDVYDFCIGDCISLYDDGPVQVFAALCGDEYAVRCENALERVENRLACLGNGMTAEFLSESLAGTATHDNDIACGKVRRFDEFFRCARRVHADLFQDALVFDFVSDSGHFALLFRCILKDRKFFSKSTCLSVH